MRAITSSIPNDMSTRTVNCPHCQQPINVGQVLGRLNSGPRRHTQENKARLTLRLVAARAKLAEKREREKREEWLGSDWMKIPVDNP